MKQDLIDQLQLLERFQSGQIPEEFSAKTDELINELIDNIKNEIQKLIEKNARLSDMVANAEDKMLLLGGEKDSVGRKLMEAEKNIAALNKEAGSFSAERERLADKIAKLENYSSTLKRENDVLEAKFKKLENTGDRRKKSFDNEYFSKYTKGIGKALLFLIVAAIVVTGVFFIFAGDLKTVKQIEVKGAADAPWPKYPISGRLDNFVFYVTFLSEDAVNKLNTPLTRIETTKRYYYLIEIEAVRGFIPEEFQKSPRISFIGKGGSIIKKGGASVETKDIYKVKSRYGGEDAELFRCVVSLKKDYKPVGILIDGLAPDTFYKIM